MKHTWELSDTIQNKIKNLEHRITSDENNLRWLYSDVPLDDVKIERGKAILQEGKEELLKIIKENDLYESVWAGFHLRD